MTDSHLETPLPDRRRTLLVAAAGTALVVLVGIVIAVTRSSDDNPSTAPDEKGTTSAGSSAFGSVSVEGGWLAPFTSTREDVAIGEPAPRVDGVSADATPVALGTTGRPTMIAFLAHWCPHCQRELPLLVELMSGHDLDGVRVVAVLTGSSADRPNFPPTAWLDREHWTGEVMLDDEASTAAQSFGLTSYPFLVFLDTDGKVVARTSGEIPAADIVRLVRSLR